MTIAGQDQELRCNGDENVKDAKTNFQCDECDDASSFNGFSKVTNIIKYLEENDRISLKAAAVSEGGFINNVLRRRVWPRLASLDRKSLPPLSQEDTQSNGFYRQVILDVDRSLKRFPPSVHEEKRCLYQDSLTKMIIRVLWHNPSLHYYQGYHDICLTFLLMMDEEEAFHLVNHVSNTHLKYFMEETMQSTSIQLQLIYLILDREEPQLCDYLHRSEVGTIFCLSWVITWFSHVLNDFDDITRLFDYFISSHFLMPIYLTVSILIYKKEEIQQIDCDMASMHQYLTRIPQNEKLPIDMLVNDTLNLSVKYPPEDMLEKQRELGKLSNASAKSTFFDQSCSFIRKNVVSIAFATVVGAVAFQVMFDYFFPKA